MYVIDCEMCGTPFKKRSARSNVRKCGSCWEAIKKDVEVSNLFETFSKIQRRLLALSDRVEKLEEQNSNLEMLVETMVSSKLMEIDLKPILQEELKEFEHNMKTLLAKVNSRMQQ